MTKQLVSTNQRHIDETLSLPTRALPAFQLFIDEFRALDIEIGNDTILQAVTDPEGFARSQFAKMVPQTEQKNVGPFKSKPVDPLQGLELPSLTKLKTLGAGALVSENL